MKYVKFGPDSLQVSRLALGTWTFAGDSLWSASDENECIDVIHAALDAGVNLFDTAPNYGSGRSEQILGKALRGRSEALVSTKCKIDGKTSQDIVGIVESSLLRMKRDRIDLMQIHWPTDNQREMDEAFHAMNLLKDSGKVRSIGVCNFGVGDLSMYGHQPIVSNQIPYSLMWRVAEQGIADASKALNLSIIAYSPLQQGLLSGAYASLDDYPANRKHTRHFSSRWPSVRHKEEGMEQETQQCLDVFLAEVDRTGLSGTSLAMAYVYSRPFIDVALAGARTIEQLKVLVGSVDIELFEETIERLNSGSRSLMSAAGARLDMYQGDRTH